MPEPIKYGVGKDGKPLYEIRYRGPDHKQHRKRGFTTIRDARNFAASVAGSILKGEYIDPKHGRTTIATLGPAWLDRKRHLKPSTFRVLESTWRNYVLPKWGGYPISRIKRTDVQAWVTNLSTGKEPGHPKRSATVIIRAYGILSGILSDAVGDRLLNANPADKVQLPRKGEKEKVYLTHVQVRDLADASKYPTVVRVLAYCGLRWGEMAGLRVRDVDTSKRRLKVVQNAVEVGGKIEVGTPKGHRSRSVPYPAFLASDIEAACKGKQRDDLVFPGPDGGFLRNARVHEKNLSWFASAIKRTGIPRVTPHDLRHSAASFAVAAGASVKGVQRMLGHKSAAMTLDVYADLFDNDLDEVAGAIDRAVTEALSGPRDMRSDAS
ncbi:MAG: tyrosine-type recombinase/integrase [Galactobacter sp.]